VAHTEGAFLGFLAETRPISAPANGLSIPPLREWDAMPVLLLGMGSFAALGLTGGLIIDASDPDPCNCVLPLTAGGAGVGLLWGTFYLLPPLKEWSKGSRVVFGGFVGGLGGAALGGVIGLLYTLPAAPLEGEPDREHPCFGKVDDCVKDFVIYGAVIGAAAGVVLGAVLGNDNGGSSDVGPILGPQSNDRFAVGLRVGF
jgi:hypothetical protein